MEICIEKSAENHQKMSIFAAFSPVFEKKCKKGKNFRKKSEFLS